MKRIHMLKRLCWSLALAVILGAAAASAAMADPAIRVATLAPDHVMPGRAVLMYVTVRNVGDAPMSGDLTIRYTFPAELSVVDPEGDDSPSPTACTPSGSVDECVIDVTGIPPGRILRYKTLTSVDPAATGTLTGQVEVSGGGATNAVTVPLAFDTAPIGPFDLKGLDVGLTDDPALTAAQGGSTPVDITTGASFWSSPADQFGLPSGNTTVVAAPENLRDVIVHVPPGFVGYPTATSVRCTAAELAQPSSISPQLPSCPLDSQIGIGLINGKDLVPVYNLEPPLGAPAEFGFYYQGLITTLRAKLRPSDNGIDIVAAKVPSSTPITKFEVTLWGTPADSAYDPVRADCTFGLIGATGSLCPSSAPRKSFLRMPTSCTGGLLPWGVDANSYEHPETFRHQDATTPAVANCGLNPFNPTLALVPSTLAPHAASGVDTTLVMPQVPVNGVTSADIRRVTVTLPDGLTVNPSSADGLQACGDADLKYRQEGAATCPAASKIGTVSVRTPLLDHPIGGSVFLRTQNSDDPQSGELFRLAIEMRSDDDGVAIRLPGSLRANPATGQLTATFDDLPQLPIDSMDLHFKTGSRAPLASPSVCGVHTANVEFTGWNGKVVTNTSSFTTSGCKGPQFAPTLRAGVQNPVAGKSSPLRVNITRTDDDQEFRSVSIDTPKGLLARVKDADQCSNDAANAGTCPAGSLIGHATVGAGVGANPFFVTNGRVYLTTGYRGAPYGLAVVVDAVAGPFNLGTVVVRQAIQVDPRTAQLTVVSDPFPTIQKGVPLHIRSVRVAVDKRNFMVNPTNCSQQTVGGSATSVDGARAPLSSRFQVGSCKSLKFAPRMRLVVGSKKHLTRGRSTPFKAVLTQRPGQSNLKSVSVALPQTLAALLPVVNRACTLAEYNSGRCAKARAGSAVARTPLLKDPLKGGAFFVRHPGRPLPDLMVALRGDISIDLVGRVTIPGGTRLATNFDTIPDAPVSKFVLSIVSGRHGPLGVSARNLCTRSARRATADVVMRGQNGDVITSNPRLHIRGCGRRK